MVTYISLWKKWKERRKGLKQEAVGNQEKQELRMKMWSAAKIPEVRTAPLQLAFSWEKRRAALVILLGKEQGLLYGNSESAGADPSLGTTTRCFMSIHVRFSCVWLFVTLWTTDCQAPLSMWFSRLEHWSGLSCPPPGNLPNSGIEPVALAGGLFTTSATWEAPNVVWSLGKWYA